MKPLLLASLTLALIGCAAPGKDADSAQEEAEKLARSEEMLNDCITQKGLQTKARACFDYSLTPEAKRQAEEHWNTTVAALNPDGRLVAAALRRDLDAAKKAIAAGANAARIVSHVELHDTRALDPSSKTSLLFVAANQYDLPMLDLLMRHGADPKWQENATSYDVVANRIDRIGQGRRLDGSPGLVTGAQIAEVALAHGYQPDARNLEFIRGAVVRNDPTGYMRFDMKPIYQRLSSAASAATRETLAQNDREELRKTMEQIEQREREERSRIDSMRRMGARICTNQMTDIGAVTYLGYVEGLAPDKAQVRVSHARMTNTPSLSPGGFRPSIVWDSLRDWYLCETGL